jgi:uncharacterized protein YukE
MVMVGADPRELENLARLLEARASQLEAVHRQLGRQLHTAPWHGPSADRFRSRWATVHSREVSGAAAFLREAGRVLNDNARQQRDASDDAGAPVCVGIAEVVVSGSTTATVAAGLKTGTDRLNAVLDRLGLAAAQIAQLRDLLAIADPAALERITAFLEKTDLLAAFKAVDHVLDVTTMVVGFIEDVANDLSTHVGLPLDEAMVHATLAAGTGLALDLGKNKLGSVIGSVVGSFIPGAGTAIGGKVVGMVLDPVIGAGLDKVDDHFQIDEKATGLVADNGLKVYQYLKAHDFNVAGIAWDKSGDVVRAIGDTAENLIDDGKEFVEEKGRALDSTVDTVLGWLR